MIWDSDFCDKHVKPILKMMVNGNAVCPRCENEENNRQFAMMVNAEIQEQQQNKRYNTLLRRSIIEDETLLKARLHNFLTHDLEETQNKHKVQGALNRYRNGEVFNLVLQGNQGAGKSHLAYSVLFDLNETKEYTCLFVSIEAMLRKIKASFDDKESKYTEDYFNRLLSDVDFLVLDDLGAETGAINTDKAATNFVQRVLYGITTSRQSKATILTTNLTSQTLFNMYDKKLVSRLLKNPEVVIFKDTKDKRMVNLSF